MRDYYKCFNKVCSTLVNISVRDMIDYSSKGLRDKYT